MSVFDLTSTIVRMTEGNYPLITEQARERFPDLQITHEPITADCRHKVLVGYYPPEDEDVSGYDWIHVPAAGVDRMLNGLKGASRMPVITRTIGRMGEQMGEYCVAYTLEQLQKMALRRAFEAEQNWWKKKAAPTHLFDMTIGILGTGSIGQGIARSFKALGARVVGYSRSGRSRAPFDQVFPMADFPGDHPPHVLVSALPWTPQTEGLINGALFSKLEGALFINVGRGASLDEDALKGALEAGQVSRAVLDVFPKEPLDETHWFWTHDQVTVTPHVSGLTRDVDAADRLVDLLGRAFEIGSMPESEVDLARGY